MGFHVIIALTITCISRMPLQSSMANIHTVTVLHQSIVTNLDTLRPPIEQGYQ